MKLVRPLMILSAAAFLAAPATQLVSAGHAQLPVSVSISNSTYPSLGYGWVGGPGLTATVTASSSPVNISVMKATTGGCSSDTFVGVSPNQSATIDAPAGSTVTSSGVGTYTVSNLPNGQNTIGVSISDSSGSNKCVSVTASTHIGTSTVYAPFLDVAQSTYPPVLREFARSNEYEYGVSIPSNYTEPVLMSYQLTSCTLAQYIQANDVCNASSTALQTKPIETTQLSTLKNGSGVFFSSTTQGFVPGELHSLSVTLYPKLASTQASLQAPPVYSNNNAGLVYDGGSVSPTTEETYAAVSNGSATDTILAAPEISLNVIISAADVTRNISLQPSDQATLKDTLYGPVPATNGSCPSSLSAYSSAPAQNPSLLQGGQSLSDNLLTLHFVSTQKDIVTTASVPLGTKYGCYAWQASAATGSDPYVASMSFPLESFNYAAPVVVTPPPAPPLPSVISLTPEYGPVTGGTTVTITGSNLNGASAVDFGSQAATIVSDNSSQLVVTDPAHAAGPVSVTVHAADGDVIAGNFTYIPVPSPPVTPVKKVVTPQVPKIVTPPAKKIVQQSPAPVKAIAPVSINHPVKHGISIVTGTGSPVRSDSVPPIVPVSLIGTGLLLAGIARKTQKAAR